MMQKNLLVGISKTSGEQEGGEGIWGNGLCWGS